MARTLLMVPLIATAAFLLAPPAAAVPECTDTAPNTRTCVTHGHTAIITTPDPAFTNPWPGWGFGFGTPAFGLGRGGVWIGI
ncbi:MAG: hypothetical protein U0R66_09495 [Mycobacterium sp.]